MSNRKEQQREISKDFASVEIDDDEVDIRMNHHHIQLTSEQRKFEKMEVFRFVDYSLNVNIE